MTSKQETPELHGGPKMNRREFVELSVAAFLVAGSLLEAGARGGQDLAGLWTITSSALERWFERPAAAAGATALVEASPIFPFPPESRETIHLGAPLAENITVIRPEILERNYRTKISYLKPAGDGRHLAEDDDPYRVYIRPNDKVFRQVFGFLYDKEEGYVRRRLEIKVIHKDQLCTTFSPDFSPFQDLYDTTTKKLTDFIQTERAERSPLPKIATIRGNIVYDFGGDLSVDDNLSRLAGQLANYSVKGLPQYLVKTCFQPLSPGESLGYGGVVVPEFVRDEQGNIVFGPDRKTPVVTMVGYVYLSTNPASLQSYSRSSEDSGELPSFGEILVHEVSHIEHALMSPPINPKDILSEEADHEVIRQQARGYINNAYNRYQLGDDGGYIFVVQSPHKNIID